MTSVVPKMPVSPFILVAVFADNCDGCKYFKGNHLAKLREKLKGYRYQEIFVARIGDPVPSNFHPDLNRFVRWWPTFILATRSSFEDKSGRLEAYVFNGVQDNGNISHVGMGKGYPFSADGVVKWISDMESSKAVPVAPLHSNGLPKSTPVKNDPYQDRNFYCEQSYIPYD